VQKNLRRIFVWIFVIALLGACGMIRDKFGRLENGSTLLTVKIPQDSMSTSAWPSINGGIMIYIVGVNGSPFATTAPINPGGGSSASVDINVPNGTYKVYALAWDGPSSGNNLQGQIGCGQSSGTGTLTGAPETVNITIGNTPADCSFLSGSVFAYSGYNTMTTNFPAITVRACNQVSTGAGNCSAVHVGSFNTNASMLIRMEGYIRNGQNFQRRPEFGIVSNCTTVGASATYNAAAILPPGNSSSIDKPFAASVSFFAATNTSCSGQPDRVIFFPQGFANGTSDAVSHVGAGGNVYVDVGP
jgi:hypothetical protein